MLLSLPPDLLTWLLAGLPLFALILANAVEARILKRALPHDALATFQPETEAGDGDLGRRSRLLVMRGLWAATAVALVVSVLVIAAIALSLILRFGDAVWLWGSLALALLSGLLGYLLLLNPVTNQLMITSGVYRLWPELERYKDVMAAAAAFGQICIPLAAGALLLPLLGPSPVSPEEMQTLRNGLDQLLFAGAAVLITGVLHVAVLHRLPVTTIEPAQERDLNRVVAAVVVFVGAVSSLKLAIFYFLTTELLDAWGPALAGVGGGRVSPFSGEVLAVATPALTGILTALGVLFGRWRRSPAPVVPKAASAHPPAPDREVSLLTLNCGLLRLGGGLDGWVGTPPLTRERRSLLPAALEASGADLLLLQEVFSGPEKAALARALQHRYPYAVWGPTLPWPPLDSGLMILSRHPLEDMVYERFDRRPRSEWLSARAFLSVRVTLPPFGTIRLVTTHTAAGRRPESPEIERIRAAQFAQLLRAVDGAREEMLILAGDFNAGPGYDPESGSLRPASWDNYRVLLRHRLPRDRRFAADPGTEGSFVNLLGEGHDAETERQLVTWDPRAPLANGGIHGFQKPQRIDHVLLDRTSLRRVRVTAMPVLGEPHVPVPPKVTLRSETGEAVQRVTLSDHRGVLVRLRLLDEPMNGPARCRVQLAGPDSDAPAAVHWNAEPTDRAV